MYYYNNYYEISGGTTSRLSELKKYTISNSFDKKYKIKTTVNGDGVDLNESVIPSKIVYYLGDIKYIDYIDGEVSNTIQIFSPQGINDINFNNVFYYKDFIDEDIINKTKLMGDVFINRKEISVFENNYRLEYMKSIGDIEVYGNGIFNVINNI